MQRILLSAIAVAAMGLGGPASASIITETLTGTISSGTDAADLFVGPNADLSGYSVMLTFSYNTAVLVADSPPLITNGTTYEYYSDTSGDGVLHESITINSNTYTIVSTDDGQIGWCSASCTGTPELYFFATDTPGLASIEPSIYGGPYDLGTGELLSQSDIDADIEGAATALFYVDDGTSSDSIDVNLAFVPPPVPEPTSWILLAIGLGGLAVLKKRRWLTYTHMLRIR
jgi:hypothetical protein